MDNYTAATYGDRIAEIYDQLESHGCAAVDAAVPVLRSWRRAVRRWSFADFRLDARFDLESDAVQLELSCHDAAGQRVSSQQLLIGESGTRLCPVRLRYAWPAELDLMARRDVALMGHPKPSRQLPSSANVEVSK